MKNNMISDYCGNSLDSLWVDFVLYLLLMMMQKLHSLTQTVLSPFFIYCLVYDLFVCVFQINRLKCSLNMSLAFLILAC